jgi:hypothetical protein
LLGFIAINLLAGFFPILGYVDLLGLVIGWLTDNAAEGIAAFWSMIFKF